MIDTMLTAVDPYSLAVPDMELAEKLIFESCHSQVAAVSLGAAHVMRAGGKRLRPLVLLLAAKACGYAAAERPARIGAAVEIIHTASLVHDDVVDESDTRRGQHSVNTFLGNEASVFMGDYLVCRALRMIAEDPDLELMRAICDVIVSMCEAEVLQIIYRGDIENTFENYFKVIRNKTACLFSFTAMAGGQIACAQRETRDRLSAFGLNLGIAFQMVDDVLDLVGQQAQLGKPTAADLREGKFTYPILHAIRHTIGEERDELLPLLARTPILSEEEIQRVIAIVRNSGGLDAAYDGAASYGAQALSALSSLPDGPALQGLRSLVNRVIHRKT